MGQFRQDSEISLSIFKQDARNFRVQALAPQPLGGLTGRGKHELRAVIAGFSIN